MSPQFSSEGKVVLCFARAGRKKAEGGYLAGALLPTWMRRPPRQARGGVRDGMRTRGLPFALGLLWSIEWMGCSSLERQELLWAVVSGVIVVVIARGRGRVALGGTGSTSAGTSNGEQRRVATSSSKRRCGYGSRTGGGDGRHVAPPMKIEDKLGGSADKKSGRGRAFGVASGEVTPGGK